MMEMAEELDFAEGAQAEHGMVERCDALDRHLALRRGVHRRAGMEDMDMTDERSPRR